jgi:hypothetical protein
MEPIAAHITANIKPGGRNKQKLQTSKKIRQNTAAY